ncbi:hypothetical protein SBA3_2740009 [Candidatus Sulfopaludibacter sp. SbA3]|nr:hypothetical protein SBA3_2740009 [Candidatus Sulfopaludibacter sp. SbA3]
MKSNRSTTENTNDGAGTAQARVACYTGPAPLKEVMFEQLDYLVAHNSGSCPNGCPECARLEHIKFWLLEPFRMVPASVR